MEHAAKLTAKRLSKEDWLDHGLNTLARAGLDALKADRLAKSLNVTRGSFYWHFKDLGDYHTAILLQWRTLMTDRVIAYVEEEAPRAGRLRLLMRRALSGDDGLERAIRSWAAQEHFVAEIVAGVDRIRVDYLAKLLGETGMPRAASRLRAQFLYWANLGRLMVGEPALQSMTSTEIDALAGLLQR